MKLAWFVSALMMAGTASMAIAAPPAYLDDRSTAAALVRSFYNAVNRHEYARAYTYFGNNNAPQTYAQFTAGYADTASVRVTTGAAVGDGAAGSTYYSLPVAIDAVSTGGAHRQFAGCYTTRLLDPTTQGPPVTPMYIYRASLKAAHGKIRNLLPNCAAQ